MSASIDEVAQRLAGIRLTPDNLAYYAGWLDRRLLINRCQACGRYHHPPSSLCPTCWSFEVEPTEVSGRGAVFSFVDLHQGPPAPDVDYARGPHRVVVVELDEQAALRHSGGLLADSRDVGIGDRVRLAWIERHGAPYPMFERDNEHAS